MKCKVSPTPVTNDFMHLNGQVFTLATHLPPQSSCGKPKEMTTISMFLNFCNLSSVARVLQWLFYEFDLRRGDEKCGVSPYVCGAQATD